MSNEKMLIDATHPEETRVVVLRQGRVEEFDYESATRTLLRGNIYLAKVTRVEPSLQAAFVEYGGNRHGFLAFNEIHPDYYQIPVADRQALLEEEAAAEAAEEAAVDARAEALARRGLARGADGTSEAPDPAARDAEAENGPEPDDDGSSGEPVVMAAAVATEEDAVVSEPVGHDAGDLDDQSSPAADPGAVEADDAAGRGVDSETTGSVEEIETTANGEPETVEQVGSDDALEELLPSRPRRRQRSYKIQEVIKRRQIILVQVVKEERGSKGAALTTYLSLAGRYTVLMPNTARGGGISRKITHPQDRKRLKAIAADLEVPEGMGLIIRTAGASRTKQEIRRDFEYLLRLWESVRELTLSSSAPSLVYEEGNLIKRSIRDLYNKDVDEIVVAGKAAHREAKAFMMMLMPSHAKSVVHYNEPEPLFTRFQIERQLNAMFSPYITLRSGGYLVINQTEALVAIDVNSGKSTREFSIEETALATNIEAAEEIARQLKLRDLAGLIVIDFIDMEEKRNNRAVERRLKEALRFDRARIQVGRISHFGLMEMSRQRIRTGVLEGSTSQCPHCQGTGIIRSTESVALAVLRGIEDALMAGAYTPLVVSTTPVVALYILNNKRNFVIDMEARHGLPITVQGSDKIHGANFTIEKGTAPHQPLRRPEHAAVSMDWGFDGDSEESLDVGADEDMASPDDRSSGDDDGRRRRGRRRGGRRGRGEAERMRESDETHARETVGLEHALSDEEGLELADFDETEASSDEAEASEGNPLSADDGHRRGRRRGRRGGRRTRTVSPAAEEGRVDGSEGEALSPADLENVNLDAGTAPGDGSDHMPQPMKTGGTQEPPFEAVPAADSGRGAERLAALKPHRRGEPVASEPRIERVVVGSDNGAGTPAPDTPPDKAEERPARKGWWQRRFGE